MNLLPYLPSAKFTVMVGALALSGLLVAGAQRIAHPQPSSIAPADNTPSTAGNWQQALRDIEARSGVEIPPAPDPDAVNTLLTAAQSPNLTTQVGRSLLITLSSAASQGLGQDIPTQEQLIAEATAQINASSHATVYTTADLTLVPQSSASLRAYGNSVMASLLAHPEASASNTYLAVGKASDAQKAELLAELTEIGNGYGAIAKALLAVPVPSTLAPLHVQLVNDYTAMASAYPDMKKIVEDPLRGLAAVQRYAGLVDEARRVFTNLAQTLSKDGILFNTDEPGTNWNAFLSS